MVITLEFLGAARQVTGSRHLLTVDGHRVLLDCGMVQGPRRVSDRENKELGIDPRSIEAVVLSHAHVDHSGSLPRLQKLGFDGPIHCTDATADLASVLLADSAHLQVADARYLAKKGETAEPAYNLEDVERTVRQFRRHHYRQRFEVVPSVVAELFDAGHILGSAMVVLEIDDHGRRVRLAFTGDHGRKGLPILRDPEPLPGCDYLITESTYGDRLHEDAALTLDQLAALVGEEMRDGGRILVPAFSVGRTQNLLYMLGQLVSAGRIPRIPIWVDSPLSTKATKIVAAHRELFDDEARALLESGNDLFFFDGVRYVSDVEESMTLNSVREGIIISASGMCEGGRVLHHLKQTLGRPEDCVAIVGFMAQGTLGRKLVSDYEQVKIFGERHRVRCKVRSFPGLSAHADWGELCDSFRHLTSRVRHAFVVHGEEDPALKFAGRLEDLGFAQVDVPVRGDVFRL